MSVSYNSTKIIYKNINIDINGSTMAAFVGHSSAGRAQSLIYCRS